MECVAEIRNNENNEIRLYEFNEELEKGSEFPSIFNWSENNYSCDCNRRLFFKRVKNEVTESDWDVECSEGMYSVNLKTKEEGKYYYREY